ncbi:NACHT domain-containing protein [Mycena venus]|uniref:NACHT domain-containing protein n=1 Tax=Mycena venus TaxID=2733690 RepID=A0A8H6X6T8_9AGAR|nr:NACHT domain-containing protein [Mycena venus]
MLRFAGESQTVNIHISGGIGGNGGGGSIQGGGGGAGEGPTINYTEHHGETAGDALHDSAERYPQPRCHPETRTQILDGLKNWSSNTDPRSAVLWLHGPAGAGKSAIAQSFCQDLEAGHRLGASFFFKRGHSSRGTATKLFSTIAYQLALSKNPFDLRHIISRRIEDDPSILHRSLPGQLQKLIVEPCQQISPNPPPVIVIDGLDECDGTDIQQEILRSLGNAIRDKQLSLRFLIASRPELHIRDIFVGPCLNCCHCPLNIEQSFNDVRKYLVDEFTRIHGDHHETMAAVPRPWPPAEVIHELVEKSSGYFIYASTVIKFIDDKDFRPTERLQVIMGIAGPEPESQSPFGALDQLYTQILVNFPTLKSFLSSNQAMFS